jgi:hypothetical protein
MLKEDITPQKVFEDTKALVEEQFNISLSILEQRVLRSIYVPPAIKTHKKDGSSRWDSIQPEIEAGFRFLTDYFPISIELAEFVLLYIHPNYVRGKIRKEYQRFLALREEMHLP